MATFRDHFSGHAGDYGRYRPHYPDALFAWLAAQVGPDARAWDCATGNGQAAVALAGHLAHVVATDASATQIAAAVPHPRVEYAVRPASASGLPDRSVSLVTVAQALHWFDFDKFWNEVRRVLKPGGTMVVECPDFDEAVREYIRGNEARIYNIFGLQRFKGDFHLYGYNQRRLREVLEACGFEAVEFKEPQDYHRDLEPCMRAEARKRA